MNTVHNVTLAMLALVVIAGCDSSGTAPRRSGNPILPGWYADPEGAVLSGRYWIFPTYSAPYEHQTFFDAFSSEDLVTWTKHERVLDSQTIKWARRAMWAPAVVEKDGKTYLFFSANDLQRPGGPLWNPSDTVNRTGGIGIAVADSPEGPYHDYLGKPLIDDFYNDAQPIDQFVFRDHDGTYYMFYGGWGHCNVGKLNDTFTGFIPWDDGTLFKEITPQGYVEGPVLFSRRGRYYFMWSEGGWGTASYRVAYAIADSPVGPFERVGVVLESDSTVATGAGHNSVINKPGSDDWYIVYHRRPIPNRGRDHRVTCIDRLYFNEDGTMKPVRITFEGVTANPR
jgi:beta-xylosidase